MARKAAHAEDEDRIYSTCAEMFRTLANPLRLKIIDLLREGEKSVSELVRLTGQRQSNISQHLAALKQRGFVTCRRKGTNVFYRLSSFKVPQLCKLIREILYDSLRESEELARRIQASKG